ncbi:MAG: hypothetical protein WCF95_05425 [bacterium]
MNIPKHTEDYVPDWTVLKKGQEPLKEVKETAKQIFFDHTVAPVVEKEVKPTHLPENSTFSHYF